MQTIHRQHPVAVAPPTTDELDLIYGVPRLMRSRTILIAALWVAAMSIALALEWPRYWQRVGLLDLTATSVLFALAAVRQAMLCTARDFETGNALPVSTHEIQDAHGAAALLRLKCDGQSPQSHRERLSEGQRIPSPPRANRHARQADAEQCQTGRLSHHRCVARRPIVLVERSISDGTLSSTGLRPVANCRSFIVFSASSMLEATWSTCPEMKSGS